MLEPSEAAGFDSVFVSDFDSVDWSEDFSGDLSADFSGDFACAESLELSLEAGADFFPP